MWCDVCVACVARVPCMTWMFLQLLDTVRHCPVKSRVCQIALGISRVLLVSTVQVPPVTHLRPSACAVPA